MSLEFSTIYSLILYASAGRVRYKKMWSAIRKIISKTVKCSLLLYNNVIQRLRFSQLYF